MTLCLQEATAAQGLITSQRLLARLVCGLLAGRAIRTDEFAGLHGPKVHNILQVEVVIQYCVCAGSGRGGGCVMALGMFAASACINGSVPATPSFAPNE